MGLERYVIEAIFREGRSHREVAAAAGVSKAWVTKLVARYRAGGELALEPRSRRPKSCAHATPRELQEAVLALRRELDAAGHDAGPHTIHHHLALTRSDIPSVATIWRILKRHGLVTPQPQKRPKCSFIRFQADLPNEMWQSDFTHWQLADDTGVEILNYLDDHSRLALACDAFFTVKGLDVVNTFHMAAQANGFPASLLTDNGAVYTGRTRKGKVLLESELERLGIVYKNSRPYHPQTCGKVERFHQTLKRYLAKQPPAASLAELQLQLDTFRAYYNHYRPHRALDGQTPLHGVQRSPQGASRSAPCATTTSASDATRWTRQAASPFATSAASATSAWAGTTSAQRITLLVAGTHIRVVDEDGRLIRELTLDPTRDYQPLGTPCGRPKIGHYVPRQVGTIT